MRTLSVASEAFPLVKTGGLADVVGALPAALAPHGVQATTLLPGYPAMAAATRGGRVVHRWTDLLRVEARLIEARLGDHPLLILDAPQLYARAGTPYADEQGRDWPDNWRRFAALARAAADLAAGRVDGYRFDILQAHDWQAALAPAYLAGDQRSTLPPTYLRTLQSPSVRPELVEACPEPRRGGHAPGAGASTGSARTAREGARAKTVITVHNIAFQGNQDQAVFPQLGLPDAMWNVEGVEYYGQVGFLKAGLQYADAITTVSPTYAREIRDPAFGMGLEGLIAARADAPGPDGVTGIVNGIDTAVWNPETDAALPATYTHRTLDRRDRNRAAVESMFGLTPGGPLFCVISRLTWQKGMDVLAAVLDDLVAAGGRLAMLGSGDAALEEAFLAAADRHPGRIAVRIGYDEPLSHLLQGGSDAILIPSRFEPCGLTQLYGLAYGCVPVVARTGGLADTVIDANEAALAAGVATGLVHDGVTPDALRSAIARTVALHAQPPRWRRLQENGMRADVSWAASGRRYADLYRQLTGRQ